MFISQNKKSSRDFSVASSENQNKVGFVSQNISIIMKKPLSSQPKSGYYSSRNSLKNSIVLDSCNYERQLNN